MRNGCQSSTGSRLAPRAGRLQTTAGSAPLRSSVIECRSGQVTVLGTTVNKVSNRLTFIDVSRAAAILFAVGDHALRHFGMMELIQGTAKYPVALLFRSATPMFYLLFGMMIELVYLRYLSRGGWAALTAKALQRSVQCYACFVLVNVVGIVVRQEGTDTLVAPLTFASDGVGAVGVLRFYALAFLLLPGIVALRAWFGRLVYPALFVAFWAVILIIIAPQQSPVPCADAACGRIAFLYGGAIGSAYSLIHGLTIIFLGGTLAASFSKDGLGVSRSRFLGTVTAIGAVLASAVLFFIVTDGVAALVTGFRTNEFRYSHHYVYYGLSTATALVLLTLFFFAQQRLDLSRVSLLGRRSLFSFTLGGALLNVFAAFHNPILLVPFSALWLVLVSAYDQWKQARAVPREAPTNA
jgi:hypothetical protein